MARTDWLTVDMDGLKALLERRGKQFAIYELVQNAWDENVTEVRITLTRPVNGKSNLIVLDDSPEGFRDLTDSFTMFASSYKKTEPTKRGAFNCGEKFVLALCDEAMITSTSGRVSFSAKGRQRSRTKRLVGTEFHAILRLTVAEWEEMGRAAAKLIPPVATWFNDELIPTRPELHQWEATLATVRADAEGNLRPTSRQTTITLYDVLEGETAMLYEMGIPVVDIECKYHVSIGQKVPLNIDRDNVQPAMLKAVLVSVLNNTETRLTKDDANANWVRVAASDPRCAPAAIAKVLDLRFGEERVSYDPSDVGSNREASSQNWTVVTGGSMSAGEWENARRANAIAPAGQRFPTNHAGKVPDKVYDRSEWTAEMLAYAVFVESVSPALVDRKVTLRYIEDSQMVCGQFFGPFYNVNLAKHFVSNWQWNIELMLHELSHTVVQSNDHLCREFYDTVGKLGAKLAILLAKQPELLPA